MHNLCERYCINEIDRRKGENERRAKRKDGFGIYMFLIPIDIIPCPIITVSLCNMMGLILPRTNSR